MAILISDFLVFLVNTYTIKVIINILSKLTYFSQCQDFVFHRVLFHKY